MSGSSGRLTSPAPSESIPVLSIGFQLFIALPTFFVALPNSKRSLRVATAGVWHNLILVAAVWLLSTEGGGAGQVLSWPFFRVVDGGVAVLSVDSVISLNGGVELN